MTKTLDNIKSYFKAKELGYQEVKEGETIRVRFSGLENAGTVEILVITDDNERTIALRSYNLLKVKDELKPKMYKVCSDLNHKFRWVKFYVDDSDNTVTAESDAVTQAGSAGEEAFELVLRMTKIIDEAYDELMRAKFA